MDLGLKEPRRAGGGFQSGIGLATAEAFAAEGCRVAMCARNQQALAGNAEKIQQAARNAKSSRKRLTSPMPPPCSRLSPPSPQKFGSVDICVTNAGGPPAKGFLAASLEDWQKAIDAELSEHGVLRAGSDSPHAAPELGTHYHHYFDHDEAAGHRSCALECGARGGGRASEESGERIRKRRNSGQQRWSWIHGHRSPEGACQSAFRESGKTEQEFFDGWAADAPLKRLGDPKELADTMVWLASERASYITGQTVLVDGGMYKGL